MIKAYTDGASRGNPGPSACSFVIYDDGKEILSSSFYLGERTNNYAEYAGLIALMQQGLTKMDIYCDSALVVKQVNGEWKVKHEDMKPLCALAQALLIRNEHTLTHIKGHSGIPGNERADQLCNECLNAREA
jgi:ribonuclease HI